MWGKLTCEKCGREIIGVDWGYGFTWICSDCEPKGLLHCEKGSKIAFVHPNSGYPGDQESAKKHLIKNGEYTVEYLSVGRSSSTIQVKEVPGIKFNSVHFERIS